MLPEGWSEIRREPDRVTFRSADQTEQATISKMDFARAPSFDDFKRLCQHRLDAEKQETKIEPLVTGPSDDAHQYTFLYSGDDKASQRLFSGYMSVVGKTLTTVYLEGIGVTAQRHLESFKAFVSGYRPVHAP